MILVLNRHSLEDLINNMEQLAFISQCKATKHLNKANAKAWKLTSIVICALTTEALLGSVSSIVMYIIDSNTKPIFFDKYSLLGINTHPLLYWIEDNVLAIVMLLISVAFYLTFFLSFEYSYVLVDYLSEEMNALSTTDESERMTLLKSNAHLYIRLLKFQKKQLSLMSGLSMLEISCTSLTVCCFLYTLSLMKFSFITFMQVASLVTTSLVPYFICYVGQQMENIGNQLVDGCYNCGWEQWTPSERKMLSLFLTGISKPKKFHYKLVFYMNMQKFGQIMQGAWSYYAVMKKLAGDNFTN